MVQRRYEPNPKHKRGCSGDGPPRWFPTRDSLCPDDFDLKLAQALLDEAIEASSAGHPDGKALIAMYDGSFYKAYRHLVDGDEAAEVWHGYPVRKELVAR